MTSLFCPVGRSGFLNKKMSSQRIFFLSGKVGVDRSGKKKSISMSQTLGPSTKQVITIEVLYS